jgi:hypothetical protein
MSIIPVAVSGFGGKGNQTLPLNHSSEGRLQIVECAVCEGNVLQPLMAGALGVGDEPGDFDDREAVIGFVVAEPHRLDRRSAVWGSPDRVLRQVDEPACPALSCTRLARVAGSRCQAEVLQFWMDDGFGVQHLLFFSLALAGETTYHLR